MAKSQQGGQAGMRMGGKHFSKAGRGKRSGVVPWAWYEIQMSFILVSEVFYVLCQASVGEVFTEY